MKFENLLGPNNNNRNIGTRLGWKQGDEEDSWSKKAIDILMKKLQKHNKQSLSLLEHALKTDGREPTDCVTIPRSIDGRIQILHRKALPHVIYCRVYRWPDLQSHHELKAIENCRYCFESGQKEVCINPYHYQRVDSASVLPPVLVPRYSELPPVLQMQPNTFARMQAMENTIGSMPQNVDLSRGFNNLANMHQQSSKQEDMMDTSTPPPHPSMVVPCSSQVIDRVPVPFVAQEYWATISYYELNTRVGEQIRVSSPTVEINGYTDPTNNPAIISLGLFSNVNRNPTIENTRRHIGKGVKLTYVPYQGTLYAECLSPSAIFLLDQCANVGGSYERCYELTKMTIIRMSFVKGWGAEYQRQDVTSTPCWIEIHLHAPLIWIDRTLAKLGPSPDPISSVS